MDKTIALNKDFALRCFTDESGQFCVDTIQTDLPWTPVLESTRSSSKEEGNKEFIRLKQKYSSHLFYT